MKVSFIFYFPFQGFPLTLKENHFTPHSEQHWDAVCISTLTEIYLGYIEKYINKNNNIFRYIWVRDVKIKHKIMTIQVILYSFLSYQSLNVNKYENSTKSDIQYGQHYHMISILYTCFKCNQVRKQEYPQQIIYKSEIFHQKREFIFLYGNIFKFHTK